MSLKTLLSFSLMGNFLLLLIIVFFSHFSLPVYQWYLVGNALILFFAVGTVWILRHHIMEALVRLSNKISHILLRKEYKTRLDFQEEKEFETLATTINDMLEELEKISQEKNIHQNELIQKNELLDLKTKEGDHLFHQLQKTQSQLIETQRKESMGPLVGGLAHDFNNLLGGILGYASLLKNRLAQDEFVSKRLQHIIYSAEKAAKLTQQLSSFSKSKEKQPTNLNHIILEAVSLLKKTMTREINIHTPLEDAVWPVSVEPTQILQMLMNLGLNACDAIIQTGEVVFETQNITADPNLSAQVWGLLCGERYVKLSVRDTGVGMSHHLQKRVFEPFFSTKPMGRGVGLGLSMVFGIIKSSQALLDLDSEEGRGTCFNIYFPVGACGEIPQKQETPSLPKNNPMASRSILVVDDEINIRDIASEILSEKGAHLFVGADGEEAVRIFEENKDQIDLVILDVLMPKMDGIQAYQKIKEINPNVPIIFCSGYMDEQKVKELQNLNHTKLILKPFMPDQFLKTINDMFQLKPAVHS